MTYAQEQVATGEYMYDIASMYAERRQETGEKKVKGEEGAGNSWTA